MDAGKERLGVSVNSGQKGAGGGPAVHVTYCIPCPAGSRDRDRNWASKTMQATSLTKDRNIPHERPKYRACGPVEHFLALAHIKTPHRLAC